MSKQTEAEARELADYIAGKVGKERAFVLATFARGEGGEATYIANMPRDDAARSLTEMLDHWREHDMARVTEPSVHTATMLRENVYMLRDEPINKVAGIMVEHLALLARAGAESNWREVAALAGGLAVQALVIFDGAQRLERAAKREGEAKPEGAG